MTTTTVATPPVKKPRAKRKSKYLDRQELLQEVLASREAGEMSHRLAVMLQLLTKKYASAANFARYTFNEDMQAYAMMMLVRTWFKFDPARSAIPNPFAFFTQCIKNSFIQYLKQEKKQRNVRDVLLVKSGLTPSFTYQLEQAEKAMIVEDEEDFSQKQKAEGQAAATDSQQ